MKRNGRRNYFIIALFLLVGLLGVGYALFAESLSITGTATSTGTFDIEFFTATVTSSSNAGEPKATISGDKNTLTLVADTLLVPTANVLYTVEVKNVGNVSADLTEVLLTDENDPDITVTLDPLLVTPLTIAPDATHSFTIEVEWDSGSSTGSKTVSYTVDLDYVQTP
ncbi:MAG: hypothetical protein PHR55_03175 [Bacilli bacterium]|nr:hypothetical protein [Bacilli bacterium]